jgi:hypothetical protein
MGNLEFGASRPRFVSASSGPFSFLPTPVRQLLRKCLDLAWRFQSVAGHLPKVTERVEELCLGVKATVAEDASSRGRRGGFGSTRGSVSRRPSDDASLCHHLILEVRDVEGCESIAS